MGNPSKGLRVRMNLRVPVALYAAVAAAAVKREVSLNDYVNAALNAYLEEHP